ncbi:MAG: hypothetical protein KAV18_06310 [Candidatus Omnitrophica bacterium]|nr:hypothetical protein [Candidatus Omnitrophota bacterium]
MMQDLNRVTRKRLGELLLEKSLITQEQLDKAVEEQKRSNSPRIGEILVELGFVTEEDILVALSAQYGCPYLPLESYQIDSEVAKIIPKEFAVEHRLIPIDRIEDVLTVAMADPLDNDSLELLKQATNCKIQIFVSTSSDILKAIEEHY